jgi:hypothetical protein
VIPFNHITGLYRLPAAIGDHICVIDGVSDTLCHLADIVGPTGHVCAWPSSSVAPPIGLVGLTSAYQNIRINDPSVGARLHKPEELKEIGFELLLYTYRPGVFRVWSDGRETIIRSVLKYMGAYTGRNTIQCVLVCWPPNLAPINDTTLVNYEQHLIRSLQPVCRFARSLNTPSYWISLVLKLDTFGQSELDQDTDLICDRVFDLVADFARPSGSIRPKEQLKIDQRFMKATVMLTARYRRT